MNVIGSNLNHLEQQIAAAVASGIPYDREVFFLQQMAKRLERHGQRTWFTARQADQLFSILSRCEVPAPSSFELPQQPPHLLASQQSSDLIE